MRGTEKFVEVWEEARGGELKIAEIERARAIEKIEWVGEIAKDVKLEGELEQQGKKRDR